MSINTGDGSGEAKLGLQLLRTALEMLQQIEHSVIWCLMNWNQQPQKHRVGLYNSFYLERTNNVSVSILRNKTKFLSFVQSEILKTKQLTKLKNIVKRNSLLSRLLKCQFCFSFSRWDFWWRPKLYLLFFPEKVLLVLQAFKHNALLQDIRMFLFWEESTAKNLDKKTPVWGRKSKLCG